MILPEPPRAIALDGTLATWAVWVVMVGAPAVVTIGTAILIVLRIIIAVKELRK